MIKSFIEIENCCCSKCRFMDLDTHSCVLVKCAKSSALLVSPKDVIDDDLPF